MGFLIACGPFFGLGITVYFEYAVCEIALGPFLFMFGDVDAITADPEDEL